MYNFFQRFVHKRDSVHKRDISSVHKRDIVHKRDSAKNITKKARSRKFAAHLSIRTLVLRSKKLKTVEKIG